MINHHLKTLPDFFQAVIDGRKTMEFRNNYRDFKPGDKCILEEYLGSTYVPDCPDRYTCPTIEVDGNGEEYVNYPPDCVRGQCMGYTKELYSGRRCLIKIKEVFDLSAAGFDGYVAFSFEIRKVIDKKAVAK